MKSKIKLKQLIKEEFPPRGDELQKLLKQHYDALIKYYQNNTDEAIDVEALNLATKRFLRFLEKELKQMKT